MLAIQNKLIRFLPPKDKTRFLDDCELVELELLQVLSEPGAVTRHIYFPTDGFVSLVTPIDGKPVLEVGMVGNEGMLGVQLALGVKSSALHAVVQGRGGAMRMGVAEFGAALKRSPALQQDVNRYLYILMTQFARSAGCLRFHQISHRLARWLLMTQDRAHSPEFYVTHEFLAYMLGVRRVGITTAAGALQRSGFIEYTRGNLTVRNRKGLEGAACGCYEEDRKTYTRLMQRASGENRSRRKVA